MKNKFKFFLVAIAATAMMFSACNKDDDENEPGNEKYQDYGDPFGEDNPYSTAPEFEKQGLIYLGYEGDIKWTPAKYVDTTHFEYELLWCDYHLKVYNETVESSEMHSFGRQKDTVYHFSFDSNLFEEYNIYYLRLITYYWYNNREYQIETDGLYLGIKEWGVE